MEIHELTAKKREESGKSKARQLRRKGFLPAVLYGHDNSTLPLAVPAKSFKSLLQTEAGVHVLLKLNIDGVNEKPTVVVKELQQDSIKDAILHVDFQRVALNEKITASVPVTLVGDSVGLRQGGVLQHGLWEVEVEALPVDLPERIEADISNLNIGDVLHVGDLTPPPKVEIKTPAEDVIATILPPTIQEEVAPAEESKEPEVVGKAEQESS
jgi:large subunit ribosomal protein L25